MEPKTASRSFWRKPLTRISSGRILMSFGLVGVWLLTVNSLIYRRGVLPKQLALTGCAGAVLYEMVFLGTMIGSEVLIDISAAGAMVLGPIWFVWLGLFLLRGRVGGGAAGSADVRE